MTTTETLASVTRDPTEFLDREVLRQVVRQLRAELPLTELSLESNSQGLPAAFETDAAQALSRNAQAAIEPICLAAALHRFVRTRAEYDEESNSGLNHPPKETLANHGNCADQSLLLYALCREAEITSRIAVIEQPQGSEHHAFVEIGFELSPSDIVDVLGNYYRVTDVIDSGQFSFCEDGSTAYFIADPVASRFLGDKSGLKKMGYLGEDNELAVTRRFTLYGDSSL